MEFDPMPPESDLLIDCPRGRVLFRSPDTDNDWIDGSPFFITNASVSPVFPRFTATGGWVSIEPLRRLGDNTELTFAVESQSRIGCMG